MSLIHGMKRWENRLYARCRISSRVLGRYKQREPGGEVREGGRRWGKVRGGGRRWEEVGKVRRGKGRWEEVGKGGRKEGKVRGGGGR